MRDRILVVLSALAAAVILSTVASVTAAGQTAKAVTGTAAKATPPPHTTGAHPDLQGIWSFATVTPLERPSELGGKAVLTDEEAAAFEQKTVKERNADANRDKTQRGVTNGSTVTSDVALAYNDFWWDRGTKVIATRRTSLIVDPPDGKIPPLTPEGKDRLAAFEAVRERPAVGPEDRTVGERCILGFNSGPPMLPGGYNQNVHIFQAPGQVALLNEMVHNARIIPIDGRPDVNIPQWVGQSRGRWEGDTLVVETKHFYQTTSFRGSSSRLHLIERFRRLDADTLMYEFTVDDPSTWTKPWTVQIPMAKTEGPIYEYACHEGNYGMFGLLSGARAGEKAAAAKKGSK